LCEDEYAKWEFANTLYHVIMLVIVKYTRLVYSSDKNLHITLKIIFLKNDIFFERVFKIIYFRALDLVLDQYKHY